MARSKCVKNQSSHRPFCQEKCASLSQGTLCVIVVYLLLCGRVVLHALLAYRRARSSAAPQAGPAAKTSTAAADAQPARGSLLVRLGSHTPAF